MTNRWMTWAAVLSCLVGQRALARDWPKTAGWTVFEGDDYCGMILEYEGKGETHLSVAKFLGGDALVILDNSDWSAKKGEKYGLEFYVGDKAFSGGTAVGTGETYERKGFATKFGADFFPAFATGNSFKVYLGDKLVDSLTLTGSAAAGAVVDRCLSHLRAEAAAAERERQRFAHIPDDPFAGAKVEARPPKPLGDPVNWTSAEDYPPSSLRAQESGATTIELSISTEGRVQDCKVTRSSGSSVLDAAACSAITRRGRYSPATGADGKPTTGATIQTVNWHLPGVM